MDMQQIVEQAGIPLLVCLVLVFYGMRLIFLQDITMIRSKDKPPVKDEKAYAKSAGKLMLLFAAAALLMAALIFVSVEAALAEIVVCTLALGILWKRMNDRYGA